MIGAYKEDGGGSGVNPEPNNSATDSGAAYAFERTGAAWSAPTYLKASNSGANDGFGISVGRHGDLLLVGAYREDTNGVGFQPAVNETGTDSGAVYAFERTGDPWTPRGMLKPLRYIAGDQFGFSVARQTAK